MSNDLDALPIVARFSLTKGEERDYGRVLHAHQYSGSGGSLSWVFYLAAIPVGILGGFAAMALGLDGRRFGAAVATLIGIAYLLGYHCRRPSRESHGETPVGGEQAGNAGPR
jgi:hypothetical protein